MNRRNTAASSEHVGECGRSGEYVVLMVTANFGSDCEGHV